MSASVNDKFRKASSGTRPEPTFLAAQKNVGASSLSVDAATGWNTTTGVDFIIYSKDAQGIRVPGSQTDWIGTLSGTTISALTLKAGTDQAYASGENTVVIASSTAAWDDSLVSGILTHANQDGTIKDGAISTAAMLGSNVVTTAKIQDDAITSAKLAPTKSTDANGWTVYDYGTWKEYKKRITISAGTKVSGESFTIASAVTLPSGMGTIGSNFIYPGNPALVDHGYAVGLGIEASTSSSAFNLTGINNDTSSRVISGWTDVTIKEA